MKRLLTAVWQLAFAALCLAVVVAVGVVWLTLAGATASNEDAPPHPECVELSIEAGRALDC